MEEMQDNYVKVYTPLGATALIVVDCSQIGQSTADPSPASLKEVVKELTENIPNWAIAHNWGCQIPNQEYYIQLWIGDI